MYSYKPLEVQLDFNEEQYDQCDDFWTATDNKNIEQLLRITDAYHCAVPVDYDALVHEYALQLGRELQYFDESSGPFTESKTDFAGLIRGTVPTMQMLPAYFALLLPYGLSDNMVTCHLGPAVPRREMGQALHCIGNLLLDQAKR